MAPPTSPNPAPDGKRKNTRSQKRAANGAAHPVHEMQERAEWEVARQRALAEMNEKHAVLTCEGGKCSVLTWITEPVGDSVRYRGQLQSFTDIRNGYLNRSIRVGTKDDKPVYSELGHYWLKWRDRKTYQSLTFDPAAEPLTVTGGMLNIWRGFGVEAKPGEREKIRDFIFRVLAAGDESHGKYILRWLAWAVQHPERQAEVALVFRGGEGVGKGTLGRLMVKIFGQHGLQIRGRRQLAGQFNAHLRDVCLLFADEAIATDDREAESILKNLITEPEIPIEGKGRDIVVVKNLTKAILATNNQWAVPAGGDARRWAVFNVPDTEQGRKVYWKALNEEIDGAGAAAFLAFLQSMQLGDWHPRDDVPQTDALREQKRLSLDPKHKWLLNLLQAGELPGAHSDNPHVAEACALLEHARKSSPRLRDESDQDLTGFIKSWGAEKRRLYFTGQRKRAWAFPDFDGLRRSWEKEFGAWEWEDPERLSWDE